MKASFILNITLAVIVLILCIRLAANSVAKAQDVNAEQAVINNIMTRTSIRSYQEKAVESDKIDRLVRAGMAAPTAVDKRPWHFVTVTDKDILNQLATANPYASMLKEAPLAIVVCGNMDKRLDGQAADFWVQDVSAASENILLAAHGMGLGAVWTGLYPMIDRSNAVARILNLPSHLVPFNIIVIGYPAAQQKPKDKYDPANVSHNTYGGNTGQEVASQTSSQTENKTWQEFDVTDDFDYNPFEFFTGDGLLLAAGNKEKSNAMTIGWGNLGTLWGHERPTLTVYVAEKRYTHQFMEHAQYFTVMGFKDKNVLHYMGAHSGRDGDKAKALGLHTAYTENGTPYYEEADLVIECRILYASPFDPKHFKDDVPKNFYDRFNAGFHSFYIGEVVRAMRK